MNHIVPYITFPKFAFLNSAAVFQSFNCFLSLNVIVFELKNDNER